MDYKELEWNFKNEDEVEDYVKLERLKIEERRLELEERRVKEQLKKDKIDLILKHTLTLFGIGVTTFTTIFLFNEGMCFEKTETFRSTTMRNFMSKNLLKIKSYEKY